MPESGTKSPSRERLEIYLREGKSLSGRERNALFLNTTQPERLFSDVSAISGIDVDGDGRGMGLTDWDADGDLDIWISNRNAPTVQVFENRWGAAAGSFLALELEGVTSNRDAAGARVTVTLKGEESTPLTRTVRLGEGFQSQSSKRLHFGLGTSPEIGSVVVRWPGPGYEKERFEGVEPNRFHLLRQGSGRAETLVPKAGQFAVAESLADGSEAVPPPDAATGLLLPFRQLFPEIRYRDLRDDETKVGGQTGKPTLLLLWHPDCVSCFGELEAMAREAEEWNALDLEILATTAEPADGEDPELATKVILKTQFPFKAGFTPGSVVERMLVLHRHLFYRPYNLAVPTAFLLDDDGRLVAVYRGEVSLETVRRHLGTLEWSEEKVAQEAELLPGSRLVEPAGLRPSVLVKVYLENQMPDEAERVYRANESHPSVARQLGEIAGTIGQSYMIAGEYAHAKRLLSEAVRNDPNDAHSRNNLAAVVLKDGDLAEAMRLWQEARDLDKTLAAPRLNLGKQLMKDGKTAAAMAALLEYHALEPDSADGHNYLAMGYLRARQFAKARTHLERLIELRPSDGVAYTNLAKVHLTLRDFVAAKAVIEAGLAAKGVDPNAQAALARLGKGLRK